MSIHVTCQCGRSLKTKDEYSGQRAKCPGCGATMVLPSIADDESDIEESLFDERANGLPTNEPLAADLLDEIRRTVQVISRTLQERNRAPEPIDQMVQREYKVLTQKDKWFSGKFDPEKLEKAINAYAQQGWIVKGVTTASIPGGLNTYREELIVLLER